MTRVDYHRVAPTYAHGRHLSAEALDRWRRAVAPFVPRRAPLRVLDVGAGTGLFTRAWSAWFGAEVVALDPAAPMLREGAEEGWPPGAHAVRGRAEAVPLRAGWADVAWLSAVFHHLGDRDRAAHHLAEALAPGGCLLVRGFLRGRSDVGWLRFFPGVERATARFPSLEEVAAAFAPVGLDVVGVEAVQEASTTLAATAEWVARMREADTLLTALTDDEVERGLTTLAAEAARHPDVRSRVTLHLVVLTRAPRSPR